MNESMLDPIFKPGLTNDKKLRLAKYHVAARFRLNTFILIFPYMPQATFLLVR